MIPYAIGFVLVAFNIFIILFVVVIWTFYSILNDVIMAITGDE
jgi:hypothetical protein